MNLRHHSRTALMIICRCHGGVPDHITAAMHAAVITIAASCCRGSRDSSTGPRLHRHGVLVDQVRQLDSRPGDRPFQLQVHHQYQGHACQQEDRPVQRLPHLRGQRLQIRRLTHSRIIPFSFPASPFLPSAAACAIFTSAPGTRNGSSCSPHPHPAHRSHSGADLGITSPPSGCSKIAYRPRSAASAEAGGAGVSDGCVTGVSPPFPRGPPSRSCRTR